MLVRILSTLLAVAAIVSILFWVSAPLGSGDGGAHHGEHSEEVHSSDTGH